MERHRSGRDLSVEMEPSAEFPILFGLLTERRKGHSASPLRQLTQHPTRRALLTSHSTPTVTIVEPDSSTPEHNDDLSIVTNQSLPPTSHSPYHRHHPSSHGSPLLILRLTSNRTDVNHEHTNSCTHHHQQRSNQGQEFQVIQHQPRPRRHTNYKVISKNEDCTPSSTTTEDEESPYKRCRMSLPTVTISNSIDPPQALSLSSYNFPVSSSQIAKVTCSTTFVTQEDDEATPSHFAIDETQSYTDPRPFLSETSSSSVFFSRNESDRPYYTCNVCDLKFKRQFHLLRHVAIHEEKRDFRCCHCQTAFYRKDNLLVHQANCQEKRYGNGMRETRIVQPHSQQQRPSRPPPRTLADLLDRQDDDYYEKYRDDSMLSSFVKLPSGLEISEVEVPFRKSSTEEEEIEESKMNIPTTPFQQLQCHGAGTTTTTMKTTKFNEAVYPCGYCHQIFLTLSHLLKHTANHIKNPVDGTFHFQIETRILEK